MVSDYNPTSALLFLQRGSAGNTSHVRLDIPCRAPTPRGCTPSPASQGARTTEQVWRSGSWPGPPPWAESPSTRLLRTWPGVPWVSPKSRGFQTSLGSLLGCSSLPVKLLSVIRNSFAHSFSLSPPPTLCPHLCLSSTRGFRMNQTQPITCSQFPWLPTHVIIQSGFPHLASGIPSETAPKAWLKAKQTKSTFPLSTTGTTIPSQTATRTVWHSFLLAKPCWFSQSSLSCTHNTASRGIHSITSPEKIPALAELCLSYILQFQAIFCLWFQTPWAFTLCWSPVGSSFFILPGLLDTHIQLLPCRADPSCALVLQDQIWFTSHPLTQYPMETYQKYPKQAKASCLEWRLELPAPLSSQTQAMNSRLLWKLRSQSWLSHPELPPQHPHMGTRAVLKSSLSSLSCRIQAPADTHRALLSFHPLIPVPALLAASSPSPKGSNTEASPGGWPSSLPLLPEEPAPNPLEPCPDISVIPKPHSSTTTHRFLIPPPCYPCWE